MEKTDYCTYYKRHEGQISPIRYKSGIKLWKLLYEGYEESNVELRAKMGRTIVSELPRRFLKKNQGRFIAITFTNKILAVCDTLEALNKELAKKNMKENYYIERIGHSSITQI